MSCCLVKIPKANLVAYAQAGDTIWLNNESNYNDKGCQPITRKARWVIFKNDIKVKDFGFNPLSATLPFGESSTFQTAKLVNGVIDLFNYILSQGHTLVEGDIVRVALYVQNCKRRTSKASVYEVPYIDINEICPDCCCDNENIIIYRSNGEDFCAEIREGNTNYCFTYAE